MAESTSRSAGARVGETLQDFWATRPARPRGKIAGVAEALGRRYGVDPVLLRILFVVGAFYGGAGLAVYLLGWLLLPKETPEGRRPTPVFTALLVIGSLFLLMFWVMQLQGLVGLSIAFLGLYLLHRNYRDRPKATAAEPQGAVPVTEKTWVYPGAKAPVQPLTDTGLDVRQNPPSWDPLAAAPFAWDLPEPQESEPEPEPERPRRRWITLLTLGIAAFAGGITISAGTPLGFTFALALGIIGAGLVVGAFLHGGRGLIGAAIPVAGLAMVFAVAPVGSGPWGEIDESPETPAQLAPEYRAAVGDVQLNLEGMALSTGQEARTRVSVDIGNISVYVPRTADVTVDCAAGQGLTNCLGRERNGDRIRNHVVDTGEDGPGGGTIVLDLRAGTGNVEVFRD
ncbi:PspC domain-containing protein [Saccharopolyspora taberi]|uniref:PspC domain-containing protein n=1 Tax=Saccharopolyspora taberi TaxID=60895 RepID=A0ABN3VIF6_9PSEU